MTVILSEPATVAEGSAGAGPSLFGGGHPPAQRALQRGFEPEHPIGGEHGSGEAVQQGRIDGVPVVQVAARPARRVCRRPRSGVQAQTWWMSKR